MPITANKRGYTGGKYAVEIDQVPAGWCYSAEGGNATADVIAEKIGTDHLQRKHLGPLKFEEISISCGAGMSKSIYDWIKTGFNQTSNQAGRRNGAIIQADYDSNEISRLSWLNGLMTEFGMPALDAASKDAAKMSIKFAPETTKRTTGAGGKATMPNNNKQAKLWTASNFRLKIDGMDCSRVSKIEALTVKQKTVENAVGELRDYEKEPASVEVPNLVITIAESHSKEFYDWHDDFVIKGHNDQDREKGGSLEYLSSNLGQVLFTLNFKQLGIFKITPEKAEAGQEQIRRLKVEMYMEDMEFQFSNAAWA